MPHVLPPPHQFSFSYYFVREIKPKLKFFGGDEWWAGGWLKRKPTAKAAAERKVASFPAPLAIKALSQLVRHIGSCDGGGVR